MGATWTCPSCGDDVLGSSCAACQEIEELNRSLQDAERGGYLRGLEDAKAAVAGRDRIRGEFREKYEIDLPANSSALAAIQRKIDEHKEREA